MRMRSAAVVCVCTVLASAVMGQQDRAAGAAPPAEETPWAVRLGNRVAQVQLAIPTVDRVVLVPDVQTYVAELRRWSPKGRWPVLIEDDVLAPLFVRAFQPAALIRRPSVRTGTDADLILPDDLDRVVIHAFGGDPAVHTARTVFTGQGFEPPGVVVTSMQDPAWMAAVALAAGRGQPLVWVDGFYGLPDHTVTDDVVRRWRTAVDEACNGSGFEFGALGEKLDTITICRQMAGKANAALPANQSMRIGGGGKNGPVAVTDFLGRSDDGERFAYVGWIWGDNARSAYMAMSSMFLRRQDVMLYNSYPESGQWGQFSMQQVAPTLRELSFTVNDVVGVDAAPTDWQRMIRHGLTDDVMLLNTKGNADWFQLRGGAVDCYDVPVLGHPLALHMVHSWSLTVPDTPGTIGQRWLRNGAYAYVGSAHEPYLGAFIPPDLVVRRCLSGVPFLIASRHWTGPFGVPWRVQTIGDPLMLWVSTTHVPRRRVEVEDREAGEDLRAMLPDLMRAAAERPAGVELERALRILYMLEQDSIAVGLWKSVSMDRATPTAARQAMPSLYRTGERALLLEAFLMLETRDALALDMLWQSWQTSFRSNMPEDDVTTFIGAIREEWPHADLKRLAPAIENAFGRNQVRLLIDRLLGRDLAANRRAALERLRTEYQ
ncbi:MAG: hypothetical protein KC983_04100 [Phycisphaerales bacterium]|nr:hypothetical protein [Phycisphaerales bacterium]